jgi:hypothetical protein
MDTVTYVPRESMASGLPFVHTVTSGRLRANSSAAMLAARYAGRTVAVDPRIAQEDSSLAVSQGNVIATVVQAETVAADKIPVAANISNSTL